MNDKHFLHWIPFASPRSATGPRVLLRQFPVRALLLLSFLSLLGGNLASVMGEIVLSGKSGTSSEEEEGTVVPDPNGEADEVQYDQVRLLNGDKFRGTFFSLDEKRGVRWRHPSVRQVLEIEPDSIRTIELNRPRATNAVANQTCLLEMANGDTLLGELVSVDTNHVTLQTWYAGRLQVPVKMTRKIFPGQTQVSSIYQGPDDLSNWQVRSSSSPRNRVAGMTGWQFKRGAFICGGNSSIGRDLKLPPKSRIDFQLSWSGYLQFGFSIYSEKLENYGGDCYMLQFNSGSVYLQRMNKQGNSSNLGHAQAEALARTSKAEISILTDAEKKSISLLMNGDLVKQWTDRGDFSGGTGVGLFQQGQGMVMIRELEVSEWDGKLDVGDGLGDDELKEDLVKLGNKDKISGNLVGIEAGNMKFGTEFATLNVPLNRIASIELASVKPEATNPVEGAVRAVFANKGAVTFSVKQWDDHQIVGHSPQLGEIKFIPSAFSRIEFNLSEKKEESDFAGGVAGPVPFPDLFQ